MNKKIYLNSLKGHILAIGLMLAASCGEDKRLTDLEEELETTTLIAYQLMDDNQKLKKKVKKLENRPIGGPSEGGGVYVKTGDIKLTEEETLALLEHSKRKLFVLRMKIMNYQLQNDTYPEDVNELRVVLGDIPLEDVSQSNVIHIERNGRGGWVYDPDEGELDLNSYKR